MGRSFSRLHRWKIRRIARKDGKAGHPRGPDGVSDEEQQILKRGITHIDQTKQQLGARIEALEGRLRQTQDAMSSVVSKFEGAVDACVSIRTSLSRSDPPSLGGGALYKLAFGVMIFGEYLYNSRAFLILKTSPLALHVIALATGVAMVVSAHYLGMKLKRKEKDFWDYALIAVAIGALVPGMIGLNKMRVAYVTSRGGEGTTENILLLVNWMFLGALVLFSYMVYDRSAEYEKAYKRALRLDRDYSKLSSRENELAAELDTARENMKNEIGRIVNITNEMIFMYRGENNRSRPGNAEQLDPEKAKLLDAEQYLVDDRPKAGQDENRRPLSEDQMKGIRDGYKQAAQRLYGGDSKSKVGG